MINAAVVVLSGQAAALGGLNPTTITALQTIVVALLVFGGQYVVAKFSNRAQSKSTQVDSQAKATEAWQKYAEKMEGRLERLEADSEENRFRIRALEQQSIRDLDLIRRLAARLRVAMKEIKRLGGAVDVEDQELTDLAEIRLTPQKETHSQ